MKKFLLGFLFFISVTEMKISFGQTYYPFPDTLASWSEGGGACEPPGNATQCDFSGWRYELGHDTIINFMKYSVVGYQPTYVYHSLQVYNDIWHYDYDNYPITHPGQIIGAVREDSTRKIWFRALGNSFLPSGFPYIQKTFKQDSDILIYDFDLSIGDTIPWKIGPNIVVSIDSQQLLNQDWRRVYNFKYGQSVWIEGAGSVLGLFGAFCYEPFEGGNGLICFKQRDSLLWEQLDWGALGCDHTITGITEVESVNSVIVFPNPANDSLTFDIRNFPNEKFYITIYNPSGQQVNQYSNLHSSKLKIPVSQLGADGLYFYILNFGEKKTYSGKFLVQR